MGEAHVAENSLQGAHKEIESLSEYSKITFITVPKVFHLEKQVQRFLYLNPSEKAEDFKRQEGHASGDAAEMAALIGSSDLLKSYEQQASEYQHRLERRD